MVILNKVYGFFEKKIFVEIAKIKDFFGGCNWNSKTSQNVQKTVVFFLKKMDGFSRQKNPNFQKIYKGSEFAVECDWISNISQNVHRMRFWKTRLVFRKKLWGF